MNNHNPKNMHLAGEWRFVLDPNKEGIHKQYYKKSLGDTALLPGTTDENKKCIQVNEIHEIEHLTSAYPFCGYAWYQKDINISRELGKKHLSLLLERTRISHVWVDDRYFGSRDSICTPQRYDFGCDMSPGVHTLTVLVDNSGLPIAGGHQTSPDTQTNWNGILGKMELQASDPVWIEDIQAYPHIDTRTVLLKLCLRNEAVSCTQGYLTISAASTNCDREHSAGEQKYLVSMQKGEVFVDIEYFMETDALLWDEYAPNMYRLSVSLDTNSTGIIYCDHKEITFGMKDFSVKGTQFSINGRTVFLRGKHDACVFPVAGYAPMEVEEWLRVFKIAKSYGINHYRFHTCCPPEACFFAADLAGMLLEVELPYWGPFKAPGENEYNASAADYLLKEGYRILEAYGNHPSFVMFSLGNELSGSREEMSRFIRELRKADSRHLYVEGSNNFFWDPSLSEEADFWVTMRTAKEDGMVRGSFSHADTPLGHIQSEQPSTTVDYSSSIKGIPKPVIGHETGQYQSYPNFKEIDKYTGVLKPHNLEIFRERLKNAGMLNKADDFFKASGKLAVLCYREEIEAALRTPGFGGFHLLDLQDFPGQGTALVGILDAFMDSKGFLLPEEWREFCSDAVLLARFPKYTYFSNEVFTAIVEIAYYRSNDMKNAILEWSLHNQGTRVGSGEFALTSIKSGENTTLGNIKIRLSEVNPPEKLILKLRLKDTDIKTHYDIWVYPADLDISIPDGIQICRSRDEAAKQLDNGRNVLLMPDPKKNPSGIEGFFASDFWCYTMFKSICENNGKDIAPGTLGIWCDHSHPALKAFPTEFHSNWQWWSILMNSRSIILDKAPAGMEPIVQIIDNVARNHKLGLIFEAKCGKGKLLVCGSDLISHTDKPETGQLLYSLFSYMVSDAFDPQNDLDLNDIPV